MAVRTQCPRCKQPLSVPNKLAGTYASCPRCQGRFWVSKDSPADPGVSDSVGVPAVGTLTLTQAPAAAPPISAPSASPPASRPIAPPVAPAAGPNGPSVSVGPVPLPTPPQLSPRQYFPSVTPQAPAPATAAVPASVPLPKVESTSGAPPAAPPQARKVARFVTADAAQSTLKLAADGQLPYLQLQEDDKSDKGQGKSRSFSPFVLILAWTISVVFTFAIVLISSGDSDPAATTQAKREAMASIEKDFFGNPGRGELLPYQRMLRDARQARARADYKAEKQFYLQVIALLKTESPGGSSNHASRGRLEKGVTGSRDRDRELAQLIEKVLGE